MNCHADSITRAGGFKMFGLSKAEKAQSAVETSMAYLLGFQGEQFVRAIYKHYPNAKKFAAEETAKGRQSTPIAGDLLRIVLTDQIDNHTTPQRRAELGEYLAADKKWEEAPFLLAKLCRAYMTMMFREVDLKKADEEWVKACVHDVYFAAKGMSADQRSGDRMVRAFEGR